MEKAEPKVADEIVVPREAGPTLRSMANTTCYIAGHPQTWIGMSALGLVFARWALGQASTAKVNSLFWA